jgi:hypothetical protein
MGEIPNAAIKPRLSFGDQQRLPMDKQLMEKQLMEKQMRWSTQGDMMPQMKNWDLFISHASEDEQAVVLRLAEALRRAGLKVCLN